MDEQAVDAQLTVEVEPSESPPETAPSEEPGQPRTPKEPPVSLASAAILIVVGAAAMLALSLLVGSVAPGLNPFSRPTPTPLVDSFADVRRVSQQALQAGKEAFARGDLDQALLNFDRANLNCPDNCQEIQDWLKKTVEAIRVRDTKATPVASQATPVPAGPAPTVASKPGFETYTNDVVGFAILVPSGWKRAENPRTDVGQGLVQFTDSGGAARFTVARDAPASDVSPELYAATIETRMQALPGYASDQVQFVNIGLLPGVKRVFRLDGRSPSGKENAVRAVQTVVGSNRLEFILTGESGASEFDRFRDAFETITNSFRAR